LTPPKSQSINLKNIQIYSDFQSKDSPMTLPLKRPHWYNTTVFTALIAVLAVSTPVAAERAADDAAHEITNAKPVKLMTVASDESGVQRTFFGRVSARQTVDLAFQVAGQITKFPAVEGDAIAAGELVAQLDLEPFQLALDRAKASRQQASRNVKRLEQLKGNASRAQLDDARTSLTITQLAVRDAQYALDRATLNAPFTAVVASRTLANFSTVAAGTPVVRLHDLSELRIEIDVPEILFQRIGENPNVELTARFPASDRLFPLEFRELNAEASRIGQTFRVTLGMSPPDDILLLPGASVSVQASLLDQPVGITVPSTAIKKSADGSVSVMRFDGSGESAKVINTPVTLVVSDSGTFQITEGLAAGDEIVVTGVDSLTDGQSVRRFKSF
jgi:RND family efflux transporter MFP subunit